MTIKDALAEEAACKVKGCSLSVMNCQRSFVPCQDTEDFIL